MPSLNGQDSICRDGSIHDITLHLLLILLIEFFVNFKLLLQETKPAVKIFVIFSITAMNDDTTGYFNKIRQAEKNRILL